MVYSPSSKTRQNDHAEKRKDPLAVKVLVGASDLLIIGHFALYLGHGLSL
jgi:hypothetical protein